MNKQHTLDAASFMAQTWLIDQETRDMMMAQLLTEGKITLSLDETPIHYTDYRYSYYEPASKKGSIAVVSIKGIIYDYYAGYISDKLDQMYADGNLAGMVVKLNSQGGATDAGYKMSDALLAAPFPTMAFIDYGQAGSCGYMLAASCDSVWASRPNDRVGSIGTYLSYQDNSEYFKKLGIVSKDIYAEQSTEKNLEGREAGKGNFKPLTDYVSAEAQAFIDFVKSRRTIDTKAGDPFKGKLFQATDALAMGLIDNIGDFRSAVSSLTSTTISSKAIPRTNMVFGYLKISTLAAVKGLAPEAITDEQVVAINKELEAEGFSGVAIVGATQFEAGVKAANELGTVKGQLTTAQGEVTRLTNELKEATDKVTALTTENNTLKGQVTKETTTPGADKTGGAQAETKQPDAGEADDTAKAIAELPHNKALAGSWLDIPAKK